MDIAELRQLARRLCAWLKLSRPATRYQQCLHYAAAVVGRHDWSDVIAAQAPAAASPGRFDEPGASRLARRLRVELGLEVSVATLLAVLSRPEARPPSLWPEGIEAGVYLITDPEAIVTAVAMYRVGSHHQPYYAETAHSHAPGASLLGPGGLARADLFDLPSGTLVLADAIELSERAWRDSIRRVGIACRMAGSQQLRVLLPVRAHSPQTELIDHLRLLARAAGRGCLEQLRDVLPERARQTRVVDWSRHESVLLPGRRPWALTRDDVYLPLEPLPAAVAEAIEAAVVDAPCGLIVVGKVGGPAQPAEELLDAMLAPTEAAGPAARIIDAVDGEAADPWATPWCQSLPWQPSIAAAYANGFRRMVINAPGLLTPDIISHADRACIIVSAGAAPDVAAALDTLASGGASGATPHTPVNASAHASAHACAQASAAALPLGRLLAVVGLLSCAARGRPREIVADCYVRPRHGEILDCPLGDAVDFVLRERHLAFEGPLADLLGSGQMTVDDVLYHFADVTRASAIRSLLMPVAGVTAAGRQQAAGG